MWVAGRAVAWPGRHHEHHSPGHGTVLPEMGRGVWAASVSLQWGRSAFLLRHFPKCLQKRSLPCGQQDGLPHGGYLLETTGAFNSQEDFMLFLVVLGGFLLLVVMILLVFFFFHLPKTPSKLGNSHHETFRVLLKNTEAEKCQG